MRPVIESPKAPTKLPASDRILEQARIHLFNYGYSAFTMDALATELGMSKKTLYVHFRSKDAILRATISNFAVGLRTEADIILVQPRLNFAEKLRGLAETIMERLGHIRPEILRELLRTAPHLHRHIEQVRSENIAQMFGRFIEAGQLAGAIHDDISPVFAGEYYMHAMQGMMHAETLRRLRLAPAETFDKALRLFFGGLLTPAGHKEYEKNFPR